MGSDHSLVRLALDELQRRYPHFDLVSIEWQIEPDRPLDPNEVYGARKRHVGPWVLVEMGQRSEHFDVTPAWAVWSFAIWKNTGALYTVGADGAVPDDPIWTP